MSVLSDGTLRRLVEAGHLGIDPFDATQVQPASIDVHASGRFRVFRNNGSTHIDPREEQPDLTEETTQEGPLPFVLHPGEFVLGSTIERFRLPNNIVGRLEGKSSLGRLGLVIHSTAGFIDPGFDGTITLELSNAATLPICLWAAMPIGQISFQYLDQTCEVPYGDPKRNSKYQGQVDPTASQMHRNWEEPGEMKTRVLPPPTPVPLTQEMTSAEFLDIDPSCICTFIGNNLKPGSQHRVPNDACPVQHKE